jgi:hypothetical protein
MKKLMVTILLLVFFYGYGQECTHTDLSKEFNFKTILKRKVKDDNECEINLSVINKSKKTEQHIFIHSDWMFASDYTDCNMVRSYTTNVKSKALVEDNDYGDLIIADFNFDGKDDFALKSESGGNGGPLYKFYLQNNNEIFVEDKYLSETMLFFPVSIDRKQNILVTLVHANAYQRSENTYKMDKSGKWNLISQRFVD